MRKRKGITLIELILALALFALVIQVTYSVFFAGATSHSISINKGFAQQDIRIAADFLTNELRFITDIGEDGYEFSEYYSLRINNKGNLIKTKHVYKDDDSIEETILRTIPGNWDSINIINNEPGVIDMRLEQVEKTGFKEAGFELSISIITENSPDMLCNVSVELAGGDILYYRNTKINSLSNSIYLNRPDGGGGNGSIDLVTVQFYLDDDATGTPYRTIMGESETTENLPDKPEREGYTFSQWNTSSDDSGISYGFGGETTFTMPSKDTNLYAIWSEAGELTRVTIDITAGIDGIVSIDGKFPKKNDGHFEVEKVTGNHEGSNVKIRLLGYDPLKHAGKVHVFVSGSPVAIEEYNHIIFKAAEKGNKTKFNMEIKIKTDGHEEVKEIYKFITTN